MNNYEEEITELKNKIAEYEAVEQYIMKTIRNGGEYDDILKAHYREGKVVDGEWVDDKEDDQIVFNCKGCDKPIVRDSEEHDNCICDDEGEKWYCEDCGLPDEEEEEEEEEQFEFENLKDFGGENEIRKHLKEFPTHKYCKECECCKGCDCCICDESEDDSDDEDDEKPRYSVWIEVFDDESKESFDCVHEKDFEYTEKGQEEAIKYYEEMKELKIENKKCVMLMDYEDGVDGCVVMEEWEED
mgnify:CR=1 FL=1